MHNATYNGRIGSVIAEYTRDGIAYVTILYDDVEINWVEKTKITVVE